MAKAAVLAEARAFKADNPSWAHIPDDAIMRLLEKKIRELRLLVMDIRISRYNGNSIEVLADIAQNSGLRDIVSTIIDLRVPDLKETWQKIMLLK